MTIFSLLLSGVIAASMSPTQADTVPSLARYLTGSWQCRGGTPSGKVMNARVTFRMALGGRFLQSEHADDPPGRYQSHALWPTDSAKGSIAMVVYDNFGGARRFTARGWTADSVVWLRDTSESHARAETFTYRRTSDSAYWYAWRVARPGGGYVLGDSATCRVAGVGDDETKVREVVSRYLHGLKFNDTVSFHESFWPDAKLMFVRRDGTLGQLSQAEWYRGFAASAGKEEEGQLRVVSVEVIGTAASAKVEEVYATSVYVDYLNLLRLNGQWRIVNKIYVALPRRS